MEVHLVVVVEKSECSEFKLLETSARIVTVIQCCIPWTSVEKNVVVSQTSTAAAVSGQTVTVLMYAHLNPRIRQFVFLEFTFAVGGILFSHAQFQAACLTVEP